MVTSQATNRLVFHLRVYIFFSINHLRGVEFTPAPDRSRPGLKRAKDLLRSQIRKYPDGEAESL